MTDFVTVNWSQLNSGGPIKISNGAEERVEVRELNDDEPKKKRKYTRRKVSNLEPNEHGTELMEKVRLKKTIEWKDIDELNAKLSKYWSKVSNNKYACHLCTKVLPAQSNIRSHVGTHFNVAVPCTICNFVSKSQDALKHHLRSAHEYYRRKVNPKCNYSEKPPPGETMFKVLNPNRFK